VAGDHHPAPIGGQGLGGHSYQLGSPRHPPAARAGGRHRAEDRGLEEQRRSSPLAHGPPENLPSRHLGE
jgi:hypothetical protein